MEDLKAEIETVKRGIEEKETEMEKRDNVYVYISMRVYLVAFVLGL